MHSDSSACKSKVDVSHITGGVRREGNLIPLSARIKAFSSETKRIPEPKQTKTQAKSQVIRATIGRMHPPPPQLREDARKETKTKQRRRDSQSKEYETENREM